VNKYWAVFKISFQQEFVYRLNFLMSRLRSVLQVFLVFFLWDAVFRNPDRVLFGYDRVKILTYAFLVLLVKSLVMQSKVADIAGEIASGSLSNYLVKPLNYFRYWWARDAASKALNTIFTVFEFVILYVLLRPGLFVQTNLIYLGFAIAATLMAMRIFITMLTLVSITPVWLPEQTWGPVFLFLTVTGFLSGVMFPLDVLPSRVLELLYMTPFPYVLFFPIQVYLGKMPIDAVMTRMAVSIVWMVVLGVGMSVVWGWGLRSYRSEGR